jgi:hypothetical protein
MEDGAVAEGLAGLRVLGERDEILQGAGGFVGEELNFELAFGSVEEGVGFAGHLRIVARCHGV